MASAPLVQPVVAETADVVSALYSRPAVLQLSDGTEWRGFSFGAVHSTSGECVFQTGMVGYVESLTDPSYTGQILVLAYPLIGYKPASNDRWGFPQSFESSRVHVTALIVGEVSEHFSHWTATRSLPQWLQDEGVPAIHGIDTRALIKHLREGGCLLAKIIISVRGIYPAIWSSPSKPDIASTVQLVDPNKENLVAKVSTKKVLQYGEGDKLILVVDCGMKYNQIRCFLKRGVRVKVVPFDHDFTNEQFDGLFLTNGPGDPTMCAVTISNISKVLAMRPAKPIFGICLGHQLLSLAAGAGTYKLRYGNRGHNQPCVQQQNKRCYLTSQNHGYAVDTSSLPADWELFYENANDKTNEGIRHKTLPFFSVQFHPEACAGPEETEYLFDVFLNNVRGLPPFESGLTRQFTPASVSVKKVVLLGSGGLSIGQAGEFDYSGSQAIKALKEEGIETVLINPNIATVQTSTDLADTVYFLPVTPDFVTDVLEKERPDGILISFGGQTALNCGMELDKRGTFARLNVKVLGTPLKAIQDTEDRGLFVQRLSEINEKAARSSTAVVVEEALKQADEIGYPVIVRAAFALGGLGSGFAHNKEELRELASKALSLSEQVLVERSMKGWKEIEYEVVRDAFDNCVTVCNMENFDPLGIHTGESIVVAPSQTLTNADYQMLRNTSIKVIRHLGIVGECNIQYALNPDSNEYCIIEVNARLSRSSALASKATAFVAAKLALGYSLPSLRNSVTKSTTACFEPALDYIVVKMPLWDLKKFDKAQREIGTAMKSVGEVMAIGRTFEEALQKAVRMANPSVQSPIDGFGALTQEGDGTTLDQHLSVPNDRRIIYLGQALQLGYDVERLHALTRIDRWFLHKLHGIVALEKRLGTFTASTLPKQILLRAKQLGFADRQIARCVASTEMAVRKLRQEQGILPFVKQIDTVSAEFPAHNNYLYVTYSGMEHDVGFKDAPGVVVLGSGGYRIGTSVEFDWSAVGCVKTLQSLGGRAIMLNCNPETVSTDYDVCDRLYFDELTLERVLDITELEKPTGVVLAVGGQIANNLAMPLYRQGVHVLGTNPEMIDAAENRYKFSRLLDTLGVSQPAWRQLSTLADARSFCAAVQYPCLVRPSYVLSGASMKVVYTDEDLETFLLNEATVVSDEFPVVISKFISGAKEIEIDAVAVKGRILAQVASEHVENAGVHSGDATIVCPPFDLRAETVAKIAEATRRIAGALDISGPFNIQYIAKENEIKVIECNVRASRSLPFVSKTIKVDLINLATKAILGRAADLAEVNIERPQYYGVKAPMFSFTRLRGADPVLGVDMASTGEVACFGRTPHEAYLKALLATGFRLPKKSVLISIGSFAEKSEFVPAARRLVELGYTLYGTPGTGDFLSEHGVAISTVMWDDEKAGAPQQLKSGLTDLYINLPSKNKYRRPATVMSHGYQTRRLAADLSIPLITNIKTAKFFVESLVHVPTLHRLSAHDSQMSRRIVLLPGLIDTHVHLREPGGEHKEDWDTGTAAALAGGFTIIAAMPNTKPAITTEDSFGLVSRLASAKARCDYAIYVGASADNVQTASLMADRAAGLKMYLNDTFSNLKLLDLATWGEHLKRWPAHVPLAVHAEGKTLAALLLMAVMNDRAVHVCHVSTKEELQLIQAAKAKGWRVTCEVCPHHLLLTHESACCSLGHPGKAEVRPSLATEDDKAYLWANLASIDTFATDHAPHTLEEKMTDKPPGFPGLETALPLMLTAVHEGKLTLEDLIAKMHTNPKRIFNLPDQPDTYVEVDLDRAWTLPDKGRYSKCGWSPYAGRKVRGSVRRVVIRGVTAYVDGQVLAPLGSGQDVRASSRVAAVAVSPAVAPRTPEVSSMRPPQSPKIPHLNSNPGLAPPAFPSLSGLSTPLTPANLEISAEALHLDRGVIASLSGKHILTVSQFTHSSLHVIFNLAHEMRLLVQRQGVTDLLRSRVMATMFYEPSTRTCTSFTAAMERLGGRVVTVTPENSSVVKGESLPDTIRTLESYVDLTVMRHPDAGAAQLAARYARKPIINGGDGTGEHPTQALLDVFTIREERGTVHGLTITLVGDLKHGRTVHSLVRLLAAYRPRLQYVSPPSLRMPREIVAELDALGIYQSEHDRLEPVLPQSDVLYVTRIQKERFASVADYEVVRNSFVITPATLVHAKSNMLLMHPLPRVAEISPDVDLDPRAAYFRQMENGMYVRMALLLLVLGKV